MTGSTGLARFLRLYRLGRGMRCQDGGETVAHSRFCIGKVSRLLRVGDQIVQFGR